MKNVLLIIIIAFIIVGCVKKQSKICACYIFPTMSYNSHCYIEISESKTMTEYYGQESDIEYRRIITKNLLLQIHHRLFQINHVIAI
jgi:hypothetical protein